MHENHLGVLAKNTFPQDLSRNSGSVGPKWKPETCTFNDQQIAFGLQWSQLTIPKYIPFWVPVTLFSYQIKK